MKTRQRCCPTLAAALLGLCLAVPALADSPATVADAAHSAPLPTDETFTMLRKARNWKSAEGPHIALFYESGPHTGSSLGTVDNDAVAVAAKEKGFEWALARVCAILKTDAPAFKIPVFLFPDAKTQGAAFGEGPTVGSACQETTITSEDGPWRETTTPARTDDLRRRAVHELTLLTLIAHYQDKLPMPFYTGAALFVQSHVPELAINPALLRPQSQTPLRALLDKNGDNFGDASQMVTTASFLNYLYGRDHAPAPKKLTAFFDAMTRAKGTGSQRADTAARSVYGLSLDALDAAWRANLVASAAHGNAAPQTMERAAL